MIAKLTGLIDSVGTNFAIIDVNGVGYLVYASARTLSRIGSTKGSHVSLLIETHVREDQITLYGFADAAEKEWYGILCTVQGVGAKVGLSILSAVSPEKLPSVIAAQDKSALRQADGVGEKLAVRICTELKEKAGKMVTGHVTPLAVKGGTAVKMPSNDAVSALINLGYGRTEAFGAVASVMRERGDDLPLGDIIRESLKELSA